MASACIRPFPGRSTGRRRRGTGSSSTSRRSPPCRRSRPAPLKDAVLPLSPEIFTEALVFLDAQSHGLAFQAPGGAAIRLSGDGFPHLAIWSKPDAPFLSLEAWSAHADWEDASGKLAERDSMTFLKPGETAGHRARMTFTAPRTGK